ncbi:MAG: dihydropteroate synthase [Bacteroidetes bacterium]|nr:MAG: dihydropteroate synthase [Bacteroidota bacterium]
MMINVKGRLMDLASPRVMGIINITDNSFFAGSRYVDDNDILAVAAGMLEEGADILDIGGCSTRPGSEEVPEPLERERVCRATDLIINRFPDAVISIDTYRASVAEAAIVKYGAAIINDISGGVMDEAMFPLVARLNVPYILMHMQGTPQTMQENPVYNDVVADILSWFGKRLKPLKEAGVKDIILDPGFGFGKNADHNFEMLQRFREFHVAGLPLLAGLSRKSLVWKTLGITPDLALNGTTALNMAALIGGASILRVHDVREARQTVTLFEKIFPSGLQFDHYS